MSDGGIFNASRTWKFPDSSPRFSGSATSRGSFHIIYRWMLCTTCQLLASLRTELALRQNVSTRLSIINLANAPSTSTTTTTTFPLPRRHCDNQTSAKHVAPQAPDQQQVVVRAPTRQNIQGLRVLRPAPTTTLAVWLQRQQPATPNVLQPASSTKGSMIS